MSYPDAEREFHDATVRLFVVMRWLHRHPCLPPTTRDPIRGNPEKAVHLWHRELMEDVNGPDRTTNGS